MRDEDYPKPGCPCIANSWRGPSRAGFFLVLIIVPFALELLAAYSSWPSFDPQKTVPSKLWISDTSVRPSSSATRAFRFLFSSSRASASSRSCRICCCSSSVAPLLARRNMLLAVSMTDIRATVPLVQSFYFAPANCPCKSGGADKPCQEKSYRGRPEGRRITLTFCVIEVQMAHRLSVGS